MTDTVVPALIGLTGSEAVALGLRSGVVVVGDTDDLAATSAPVVDQDPKAALTVEAGSTVRVVLGRSGPGDALVPPPDTSPDAPGRMHPHDEPDRLDLTADRPGEPA
jgi:beta-lactam-binding protein with PASTA domain